MIAASDNKRISTPEVRPICRIELFGGVRVRIGDRLIERFRTRKAASLLARLALFPDRAHPREELINLLWPDMDEEAGRANLRQTLWTLRLLVETGHESREPILCADNSTVRLLPGTVTSDVAEFEAAIENSVIDHRADVDARASAIELYRGELLNGYYDEWILPERRRLEALYRAALHEQISALAEAGDLPRAIAYAVSAVQMDPCNEEAHVGVMRLHASAGDPPAVRRQLDELKRTLQDEMGAKPSAETCSVACSLIEEATANEGALRVRMAKRFLEQQSSRGDRPIALPPFWKRTKVVVAACACLATFLFVPARWMQRAPASAASIQSPVNRQLMELRALRISKFAAGTPAEIRDARRRHASICLALGEQAWSCWYGRGEEEWLQRFTESNEDLRTALLWMLDNDPDQAVQLSGALTRFWYVRNFPREGYRWLNESLSRAHHSRTTARARALVGCAFLAMKYDAKSNAQCREALSIFRERGDKWGEAHALRHLGYLACSRSQFTVARPYYDEALAIYSALKDDRGVAVTSLCLSFLGPRATRVDQAECQKWAERSLELFAKLQNPWGVSMALDSLGLAEPDKQKAIILFQSALAKYPEANGLSGKESSEQAMVALLKNDYPGVRRHCLRIMQISRDQGSGTGVSYGLTMFLRCPDLDATRAARLYGAVTTLNNKLGLDINQHLDDIRVRLVARLGKGQFDVAVRQGDNLTGEQAVDEAERMN